MSRDDEANLITVIEGLLACGLPNVTGSARIR